MQNRTGKFLKNVIASALLQIVAIVTGFISQKLMLNTFGSEINGIVSSIIQFVAYLTLVEAGLSNATVFALFKPIADKDPGARDSVISATRISYRNIGLLFIGLSIVLAVIYPYIGSTNALSRLDLSILVLILCVSSALNFFIMAKYRSLLTADQCAFYLSIVNSIQLVVHLLLVYIMIKIGLNVVWVRGVGILSVFVSTLLLSVIVRWKYGKINCYATPNKKALDKRWDAMILQILGIVVGGAPTIIMTMILNYSIISVYTVYNMIVGSITTCVSVFTSGLGAAFGEIYATGDDKLLSQTSEQFRTAFYMLITIIYSITMITLLPFISLYTKGIEDAQYYLRLFALLITLNGLIEIIRSPHGMLIFSTGKFHIIRRQSIIQAVIVIALGIIMTKVWGLNGIIAALCIGNIYMLFVMLLIAPKQLVKLSLKKDIERIARVFCLVLFLYIVSYLVGFRPLNYFEWFAYACSVGVFSILITLGCNFIFDRAMVIEIMQRLKKYFNLRFVHSEAK